MLNSRSLLSKKGLLSSVWTAAHYLKKLKKEQVMETDIVACVDTILNGEDDEVTYWILAYLLLGVVRIYSKKVELLNHDFADLLREANNFIAGKIVNKSIKSYCSITVPEKFELYAFNLDILEDQDVSRVHVRSREDITIADVSRGEIYCKNDEYYDQEDISSYEAFSSANTPVRDVCSPWFMDIDSDSRSPYDINILKSSMEKLVGTRFSLGKCLEQKLLRDIEKEAGFDMSSNEGRQADGEQIKHHDSGILIEKSIDNESMQPMTLVDAEKESGLDVLLDEGQTDGEQIKCPDVEINCRELARLEKSIDDESLEPMIVGDAEEEPGFDMPSNAGYQTDGQVLEHPDVEINYQEPAMMEKSVDNELSMEKVRQFPFSLVDHLQPVILGEVEREYHNAMPSKEGHQMLREQIKNPVTRINFEEPEEKRLPEMTSFRNQIQEKSSLSISVNVTPDSKSIGGSGAGSPEVIGLRTPAPKERARVLKKRKCLVDEEIIISNKVLQNQINDPHDLVCKRSEAPSTVLQAWKVRKIYNLPKTFFEPLVPCKGVDFRSFVSEKKLRTRLSVETAEIPTNPVIVESPITQMSVAPAETPVNRVLVESSITQMSVKLAKTPIDPVLVESPIAQISLETAETPENPILVESSVTQISEQTPIAPTPFTPSTSLRLHEVQGLSKPAMLESARSFNSVEKQSTLDKDQELNIGLMDEEVNSSATGNAEKCEWSAQTWRVATYLHWNISKLTEHKGDDGFVNLSQVLERKTITECARLFYEILALKTGDYINVRQEDAYGDILVQETPKLKQTIDAYGNKPRA